VTGGVSIRGLQEAQARNLRRIAALQPGGVLGRAIQHAAAQAHRWLTYYTPYETGALRASRRIDFDPAGPSATIYTDPGARNPASKTPPAEYDVYLHQRGMIPGRRGGIQASMPYTIRRRGEQIGRGLIQTVVRGIHGTS